MELAKLDIEVRPEESPIVVLLTPIGVVSGLGFVRRNSAGVLWDGTQETEIGEILTTEFPDNDPPA